MKIAIVGSRNFKDIEFVKWTIYEFLDKRSRLDTLVSGGAIGVDTLAEEVARQMHITCKVIKPNWELYGKAAGFRRNELIVNESDKVIAFWDGESKGTKHTIDLAIKAGKPVDIYIRK